LENNDEYTNEVRCHCPANGILAKTDCPVIERGMGSRTLSLPGHELVLEVLAGFADASGEASF